jgi:hypothetical protein
MPSGVILVFRSWKLRSPLLWSILSETTQVIFKAFVHNLSVAFHLRVVTGTHLQSSTLQLEELFPKGTGKSRIPIRDNRSGHAQLENVGNEQLSYLGCCKWMSKRNEIDVL